MRRFELLLALVGLAQAAGCGVFRRLAGNDTVSLEKADVKAMSVDLRRANKTICPREPVQMAVFVDFVPEGEKETKRVETWQGRGDANKNDKLDFAEFAFYSSLGTFDRDGWFAPNANLLLSAGREFEIKSVYRRRPDKFSFTTSYKPDYGCITGAGGEGAAGPYGGSGVAGATGKSGAPGSGTQPGGDAGDGGSGTGGGSGGDGAQGPRFAAYATIVKTPFYDRLVAIAIEGDVNDFLLVPEGQPVTLRARGGSGGPGGDGGPGGSGGQGGSGIPGGRGGKGGSGGPGGSGGNGGHGGSIELVYDVRFGELRQQIKLDVNGGDAGSGGPGGGAGSAGRGGMGLTPTSSSGSTPSSPNGADGSAGTPGSSGAPGRPGAPGRAAVKAGDVAEKFAGREGVTIL